MDLSKLSLIIISIFSLSFMWGSMFWIISRLQRPRCPVWCCSSTSASVFLSSSFFPGTSHGVIPHWRVLLWRASVWRVSLWRLPFWRGSSSARFSLARFHFGAFLFGALPNFVRTYDDPVSANASFARTVSFLRRNAFYASLARISFCVAYLFVLMFPICEEVFSTPVWRISRFAPMLPTLSIG